MVLFHQFQALAFQPVSHIILLALVAVFTWVWIMRLVLAQELWHLLMVLWLFLMIIVLLGVIWAIHVVVPVVVSHMVVIRFISYVVLMVRFMHLLSLIYIVVL